MIFILTIAVQAAQQDSTQGVRLVLALLCVVVASSVALGASIGLARRIHHIADRNASTQPDEDKADADEEIRQQ